VKYARHPKAASICLHPANSFPLSQVIVLTSSLGNGESIEIIASVAYFASHNLLKKEHHSTFYGVFIKNTPLLGFVRIEG